MKSRILFCLTVIILTLISCKGKVSEKDIRAVKYNFDYSKIYYLQDIEYFIAVHPSESDRLYYSDINLLKKDKIIECDMYSSKMYPNPVEDTVFFVKNINQGSQLILYNKKMEKILFKKKYKTPWPMHVGWHPNGEYIYLTDDTGIKLLDKNGKIFKSIIKTSGFSLVYHDNCYCLNWSDDGNFIIYTTDKDRQENNELILYDINTNVKTTIKSIEMGLFNFAYFMNKNSIIYEYQIGEEHYIKKININNKSDELLYRTNNQITKLIISKNNDIIFSENNNYINNFIKIIDDAKEIKDISDNIGWDYPWDYNFNNNSLIVKEKRKNNFKIISLE